jgi:hypothetical protein
MPSTCWNSMAVTCAPSPGRTGAGSLRGYYVARVTASNYPTTWKGATATQHSATRAPWGSKALSPSGGISLSLGPLAGLDQGEEPGRAGRDKADRRLMLPVLA